MRDLQKVVDKLSGVDKKFSECTWGMALANSTPRFAFLTNSLTSHSSYHHPTVSAIFSLAGKLSE